MMQLMHLTQYEAELKALKLLLRHIILLCNGCALFQLDVGSHDTESGCCVAACELCLWDYVNGINGRLWFTDAVVSPDTLCS